MEEDKEEVKNPPKDKSMTWTVVAAIVIIAGLIIALYYFINKTSKLEKQIASYSSTTSTSSTTSSSGVTSTETPKAVTENFMKYTLGTLPGASVNLQAAREYMDDSLSAKYPGDDFVPLLYGIQDGPSKVELVTENVNGNTASVKYNATFGNTMLGWVFNLTKTADGWKISEFRSDAQ